MAVRPSQVLEWATEDITELRDLGSGLQSYDNKFFPPVQMQNEGILVKESFYRSVLNYLFNNIFSFIKHLDERYSVGDIHLTTSSESASQISERLGGTWVARGTNGIGTITANVFEKTA